MTVLDLFAGAGGASLALAELELDPVGFEWNRDAARTHAAAGHRTVVADLSSYGWRHLSGRVRLLHASPPCQPFSAAGDGAGDDDPRDGMPWVLRAVEECRPVLVTVENVPGLTFERHAAYLGAFLRRLAALGYEVGWRVLNAADYGVPQVRRRLLVVARRDGHRVAWPLPTHTERHGVFTEPWVTMADALGWRRDAAVVGWRGAGMVERHGTRPPRMATAPSPAVGAHPSRWHLRPGTHPSPGDPHGNRRLWSSDGPAPTIAFAGHGSNHGAWTWERPATTIAADPRVFPPGHHDPAVSGSQSDGAIRVPLEDLATLQGFPPGYPFHGSRTSIARQIGNALPPPLLAAVVRVNL